MRYVAERDGFVDSHYVCAGEEFEYSGKTPSWARPLEPVQAIVNDVVEEIAKVKAKRVVRRKPVRRAKPKQKPIAAEPAEMQEQTLTLQEQ